MAEKKQVTFIMKIEATFDELPGESEMERMLSTITEDGTLIKAELHSSGPFVLDLRYRY